MRDLARAIVFFSVFALIAAVAPAAAQTIDGDSPAPDELAPLPGRDLVRPPHLPTPKPPENGVPTGVTVHFQLVGFTTDTMPANKGVLNYTLACQREFPNSRMCTIDDINRTVRVPPVIGYGHAWLRQGDPVPVMRRDAGVAPPRPRDVPVEATDCDGFTSTSPDLFGTAMDFGEEAGCYGGYHAKSCDQQLVIACCALLPTTIE